MPMTRNRWARTLQILAIAGLLAPATTAAAADATKAECIAASENAQDLRHAGKLRESRTRATVCIEASCPGLVREDCARLVDELDKAMPTIVFEVKDSAGNDVSPVRVTMDGQPLTDQLGGTPMPVDPGGHRFVFEADFLPSTEKTMVLREGEKNRHEQIVLGGVAVASASSQEASPTKAASTDGSSQRTIGLVLGGAGVAGVVVGSIFGLVASSAWSSSQSECASPTNCPSHAKAVTDHDSATSAGTISTIGFLAGGALLGTGAVLFFTAPSKHESSSAAHLEIAPRIGSESGGLMLRGRF